MGFLIRASFFVVQPLILQNTNPKDGGFWFGLLDEIKSLGDLFGALSHSFTAPFSPFPEIGINEMSIRTILSLNTLIQFIALLLMFRPQVKAYFRV